MIESDELALSSGRKNEIPLAGDASGLFLKVIVAISAFLFVLPLSGALSINAMLDGWSRGILGSFTVQIMPVNTADKDQGYKLTLEHQEKVADFLSRKDDAFAKVEPLGDEQLYKLIQPWLGDGVEFSNLPVPRLIDVSVRPGAEAGIDFKKLAEELAEVSPFASVDNHKLWLGKLIRFADAVRALSVAVLAMVVLMTSSAVLYTTRTSLGLHAYTISILHQLGAKDTYIAQQYARRACWLGLAGGTIGLVMAIPAIVLVSALSGQIEGGIISEAELSLVAWGLILCVPLFASALASAAAYLAVKRTLSEMP